MDSEQGLSLPPAFLQLMTSHDLQDRVPSCTACYFDLPDTIVPCPQSENGYLIRFLNDQQGCLFWYLYLTPQGEEGVLTSPFCLDTLSQYTEREDFPPELFQKKVKESTYICAEEFLYRFWLENTIWFTLNRHLPLPVEQERYLDHYLPKDVWDYTYSTGENHSHPIRNR
jgi:hypothetical protein